jgi:hypothetical protein
MFHKKNNFWVLLLVVILAFVLSYYFLGNAFSMREDYTIYENDKIKVELIPKESPSSVNLKMRSKKNKKLSLPNLEDTSKKSEILMSDGSLDSPEISIKDSSSKDSSSKDLVSHGTDNSRDSDTVDQDDGSDSSKMILLDSAHNLESQGDKAADDGNGGKAKEIYQQAKEKYTEALSETSNRNTYTDIGKSLDNLNGKINTLNANDGFQNRSPQSGGDLEFQYMMDRPRVL